ncbi:DUF4835 family protein [Coprobacter tertius]|uniref:DUF4835 family protein n=1 Tax=Coprobacter tertius TaxID=2944915 RepID=A0ABT1MJK2_9BACT|nr:DUF4835 family protein [Coprobacter tertius]MCP9612056.1 DUF4835 family protein [Coprobacter tertius]
MRRFLIIICFLLGVVTWPVLSQELKCTVQINSDKIQGTNKQVFNTLQQAITEYINNRKWSEAQISNSEMIECSMVITVNEVNDNRYKCNLQIQAKRPVYNASYTTTTMNFKDNEFEFNYQEFEPLIYNENTIESNLTAVLDFYCYMILGIDFDSFSPKGGDYFYQKAEHVVNMGQSSMESGWKAFDNTRNRHALVTAFTDQRTAVFRELWYMYHRQGLDEMALSVDKGRAKITEAVKKIQDLYSAASTTVLLPFFSDTKLDELVNIYSKAPKEEKEEVYKVLSGIYPTQGARLQEIRKEK